MIVMSNDKIVMSNDKIVMSLKGYDQEQNGFAMGQGYRGEGG